MSVLSARTQRILEAPVLPLLLSLAAPNIGEAAARITFLTADAIFVSWLGSDALAGVAVVFPLFLVLFGVGDRTKISVAAFGAALVILFNVAYGVMNARKTRLLAAKAMGASRLRILIDVMLLESLPQTFVGLRNGVSLALVIVVVAEMFIGSTDGLGNRVFEAQQLFAMPDMYAAIFAAGALGYGLNLLFLLVERRFVHWAGK